jgi:hypothetical protein
MSSAPHLPSAKVRALQFIASQQQADGSFVSFSSPNRAPFAKKHAYTTIFTAAIMLTSLAGLEEEAAVKVRNHLAEWLLQQKSPNWSFNYWAVGAPERAALPYPDDLDDTFCALIGLQLHDQSLLGGSALAHIVKLLIATETMAGGPYCTWLVPKKSEAAWLDVDLAVNCNVNYFLSLISNPLPNLNRLLARAITKKEFSSPYYPSEYPVLYYVARACHGSKRAALVKYILGLRAADGSWGTPLQTALMVSALCSLGHTTDLESAKTYLLARQRRDGSWDAEAFCLDPAQGQRQYFSGAPALTTALVLEALHKLEEVWANVKTHPSSSLDKRASSIYDTVMTAAQKQFSALGPEVSSGALALLERLTTGSQGENIILLPYTFYQSLRVRPVLDDQLFVNLGLANLYGWIAYTIYDDFLDDEGKPELLSAANVALRSSLREFELALPRNLTFQSLVQKTFNTMDSANAWEVRHCRFTIEDYRLKLHKLPDYTGLERLAERSLGHTLTPLAILIAVGEPLDSPAALACLQALRHYLIARQLNDDLHDWEDDVNRGQITYVVSEILRDLKLRTRQQDLRRLLGVMRQQFWHLSLPRLSQTITQHIEQARQLLADHPLLQPSNALTDLLDGVALVNRETLATVMQAEDFLKSYRADK